MNAAVLLSTFVILPHGGIVMCSFGFAALVGLVNDMCIELLGGDATEAVVEPGLGAKERAASTAKTAIGKLQELKMTLRRQSFDAKEQQFEVEHLRSQALLLRATTASDCACTGLTCLRANVV